MKVSVFRDLFSILPRSFLMSIQEFHARMSSRGEASAFFAALRKVRATEDLVEAMREGISFAGWYPWHGELDPEGANA